MMMSCLCEGVLLTAARPHLSSSRPVSESNDHTTSCVPAGQRRGLLTMGLLWLTMVTGFPSLLIGFDWYRAGFSLPQVVECVLGSCVILLAYSIPAALLGAKSGQTMALLSRSVFGRWGSWLVSLNLVWVSVGWYGLNAIFLTDGLMGLYHWAVPRVLLAGILALLMAFNNFFGFTGIANFARYLAAPVLIAWIGFTFFRAAGTCPASVLAAPAVQPLPQVFAAVSSFVIGYSVWGNEADYWRYGKPSLFHCVIPLVVALLIGQLIFPATGWMIACMSGVTDYAQAAALMNKYAFGGVPLIAAAVLSISYLAVNDSGLYGAINALENIRELPRRQVVAYLAAGGAVTAMLMSDSSKAFELVTTLSGIFLPCATVIVISEFFLVRPLLKLDVNLDQVVKLEDLPPLRLPPLLALIAGFSVGVVTSGLVPGLQWLHVGVCSLQAWLVALFVHFHLRFFEHYRQARRQKLLVAEVVDRQS